MAARGLRGGLPLFSFKGIKVLVHWSFLLLPAWIIGSGLANGEPWSEVIAQTGLVLIVFVCVVLHEFGHALTAQRYGIRTRDITLLPIGGVASLERMPEDPRQEFWITIAGPLVNLVIAALSFTAIAATGISLFFSDVLLGATSWTNVLMFVFTANLSLFLFNLLPAFPMDGGRILRSVLSMRMPRERATRIAAQVGRIFAVGFVIGGIFLGAPFMAFIGVFVYLAAGAEARSVKQKAMLDGITVGQVMRTRFWAMPSTAQVQQAVDELLAGGDSTLVIMDGTAFRGLLTREDILGAVAEGKTGLQLAELPLRQALLVAPEASAHESYQRMVLEGHSILPVVSQDRVAGIMELENLSEYLQLMQARGVNR
jgi:Zn-dependent protease/CBS domain-containing protein